MRRIVVLGGGGHGKVVMDIVHRERQYDLVGVIDSKETLAEAWLLGVQVIGVVNNLPELVRTYNIDGLVIGIGDNWLRSQLVKRVRNLIPNVEFVNAVHPRARIAPSATFGVGNVVMAGATINSDTRIGNFCVLNTNCSIDHDCVLEDYVSFGPNSCAGGMVEIREFTAVSLGANVIHNIKIGAHTVVGAGATVLSDVPSHVVAYGTPSRVVRERAEGETYL